MKKEKGYKIYSRDETGKWTASPSSYRIMDINSSGVLVRKITDNIYDETSIPYRIPLENFTFVKVREEQ